MNTTHTEADLARKNLRQADLAGRDLRQANLANADLADANLTDANLAGAKGITIHHPPTTTPRGYSAYFYRQNHEWRLVTGCRNFSHHQAHQHWADHHHQIDWLNTHWPT